MLKQFMSVPWALTGLYRPVGASSQAHGPQTFRLAFLNRYKWVLLEYKIKFLGTDTSQELAPTGWYGPVGAGVDCADKIWFWKVPTESRGQDLFKYHITFILLLTELSISLLPFMWIMVSGRNEEKDKKLNNGDDIQLYPYNLLRSKWLILSIITTCNAIFE